MASGTGSKPVQEPVTFHLNTTFKPMSNNNSYASNSMSLKDARSAFPSSDGPIRAAAAVANTASRKELLPMQSLVGLDTRDTLRAAADDQQQHTPATPAAEPAMQQYDEFSLSKIFYGVWSPEVPDQLNATSFLNSLLGPVDSNMKAIPASAQPKKRSGPALLDDLLKQGFFYRILELLQLQTGPEVQVQALNVMAHILEDRRISPKAALRKGLTSTLLQLLSVSADETHLLSVTVVIGRLARDTACRDDMLQHGVLQSLIAKVTGMAHNTDVVIAAARALSRICTCSNDSYVLHLSMYNIKSAVAMLGKVLHQHLQDPAVIKYITRCIYNLALSLAKIVQGEFIQGLMTSDVFRTMMTVLSTTACHETAENVLRSLQLAYLAGFGNQARHAGAVSALAMSLRTVKINSEAGYDDAFLRVIAASDYFQDVNQIIDLIAKHENACQGIYKLFLLSLQSGSFDSSRRLHIANRMCSTIQKVSSAEAAVLIQQDAIKHLMRALQQLREGSDWASAGCLLSGIYALLQFSQQAPDPNRSMVDLLGGQEAAEYVSSLNRYKDITTIRNDDYNAARKYADCIQGLMSGGLDGVAADGSGSLAAPPALTMVPSVDLAEALDGTTSGGKPAEQAL